MARQKCLFTFKWQGKSVRLNGKTKVNVLRLNGKTKVYV